MFHAGCSLESQVSGIKKLHKAGTGVDVRRKDKRIRRHQVVEFGELIRQGWRASRIVRPLAVETKRGDLLVGRGGSNHVHLEDS